MRRCLIAVLGVIGCLAATQALAERRVALVIGNAQYAHTPALPNPRNDAQDIADALRRVGFEVTLGYDLDQIRFARTIDDFARALEGADVGLFFYAGHGLQINEKNYLVSTEAKLESTFLVPSETIELDAVIRLMESKANTNLIFLDACRNNPLTDNLKRNLAAINRTVSVGRGLARIEPTGRDTLVAFSSAPGQEAADGRGRNSPFTASLLRHMPKPGLEVSVMLKEVTADVRQETNNVQRPQQLSDMSKAFYFVKAEPAVVSAPRPGAPVAPTDPVDPVDVAFWQSAAAASECEAIRAYLRRFPNGRFVDLARISERRLCKAGLEVAVAPPQRPSSPPVAPALTPGPAAAPAAPSPGTQPAGAATNVAVAAPTGVSQPAAPIVAPVVAPDVVDIGRKLQKELQRVGCAASGIETESIWGTTSREALRSFNERTRSVAAVAARPPEREQSLRAQRHVEPGRADAPRPGSTSYANAPISPNNRNGESWIYVGKQRCKTYEPPGSAPRIICP